MINFKGTLTRPSAVRKRAMVIDKTSPTTLLTNVKRQYSLTVCRDIKMLKLQHNARMNRIGSLEHKKLAGRYGTLHDVYVIYVCSVSLILFIFLCFIALYILYFNFLYDLNNRPNNDDDDDAKA